MYVNVLLCNILVKPRSSWSLALKPHKSANKRGSFSGLQTWEVFAYFSHELTKDL